MMFLGVIAMQAENWYAGGSLGFYDTNATGKSKATFLVAPEAGYWFTDNLALGVSLDMLFYKDYTGINISPYLRYSYYTMGKVSFFIDGGGTIAAADSKGWKLGLEPGIAFNINERITVLSHLGFLGYQKLNDTNHLGKKIHITGLALTNDLSFSIFYNF